MFDAKIVILKPWDKMVYPNNLKDKKLLCPECCGTGIMWKLRISALSYYYKESPLEWVAYETTCDKCKGTGLRGNWIA